MGLLSDPLFLYICWHLEGQENDFSVSLKYRELIINSLNDCISPQKGTKKVRLPCNRASHLCFPAQLVMFPSSLQSAISPISKQRTYCKWSALKLISSHRELIKTDKGLYISYLWRSRWNHHHKNSRWTILQLTKGEQEETRRMLNFIYSKVQIVSRWIQCSKILHCWGDMIWSW